jgi:glycosyltransferase involved in cell wall biosynthesis
VRSDSLSLILPVRNAERTLPTQVERLLDVAADLSSRFEIVVVDDGSTDATAETAADLARKYPQLRLIRNSWPLGLAAAVKAGVRTAAGETVIVQEDPAPLSPASLRRLWSLRHDKGVVMARSQQKASAFEPDVLHRLSAWGQELRELAKRNAAGGVQMIRREGVTAAATETKSDEAQTNDQGRMDLPHAVEHFRRHSQVFVRQLRDLAIGE